MRDKDELFDENSNDIDNLIDFNGVGKYSSPELVWNNTIAPSAIKFLDSDMLGKEYLNDLFVGNVNDQSLYHFDLSNNRQELVLSGNLSDRTAESNNDLDSLVFGEQFGRITDIEVGPDGNLYVLSHLSGSEQNFRNGSIFKISKVGN
jgi:glucose/arabinose dehydrogenase